MKPSLHSILAMMTLGCTGTAGPAAVVSPSHAVGGHGSIDDAQSAMSPAPPVDAGATPSSPCLFDSAEGRYKRCHHVIADGTCAHFGAWCGGDTMQSSPEPTCLFDPADGRQKRCHHVTADGACAHFGAWCGGDDLSPRNGGPPCLFDPSDGRQKECHHVTADGKCAHFGAACRP